MTTAHSVAPWFVVEGDIIKIVNSDGLELACVQGFVVEEEMRANGLIMAAAPDMLIALKTVCMAIIKGGKEPGWAILDEIMDAIKKATGE